MKARQAVIKNMIELDLTGDATRFRLPPGVDARLQRLLDKQDSEGDLSPEERKEAEGLVELAEMLSLLNLRIRRMAG
jgi:hypothetical protein